MKESHAIDPIALSQDGEQHDTRDESAFRRSQRRQRAILYGARFAFVGTVLAAWEGTARWLVDPFWISQPTRVGMRLYEWIVTGFLFTHIWSTMQAMLLGLMLGSAVGIVVGFVLGRTDFLAQVLDPFITAVYSLPRIALAPLFVLWFGIGLTPKVMLVAVVVFFLTFRSTYSGVQSVEEDLLNVVRVMGASRRDEIRKVVFPSALSWIFVGLRLSVPYALVGAVVAEFVAASSGLGWLIRNASGRFDTVGVFSGLIVLGIFGFLLNGVVDFMESRSTRWRSVKTLGPSV